MRKLLILILGCLFVCNAYAEDSCPSLETSRVLSDGLTVEYIFKQHSFADKKQDLVIVELKPNAPTDIRQVTFGHGTGVTGCYFQPLAFKQGGGADKYWGWHLFWSEPAGLFYARMDGEAWVSSLPKRFTKLAPMDAQFKLDGQNIVITWQQLENGIKSTMQAASSDEGRSWDETEVKP